MNRTADILVLGGGIVGLATAYYAARRKLGRITILERDRIGRGASSRNLGGIREQFSNEPTIRLMKQSIDLWEKLPEELEWNFLYDQKGYLLVARSEGQLAQLKTNAALQNSLGVRTRILTREEVLTMIPQLEAPDLVGASFNHRDGSVHHDAVLWAFKRAVLKLGVEVLEGVECRSIKTRSGKAIGAETSAGEFSATKIVNATGVYSRDLAATVGIDLPVKSFRREALVTEPYKRVLRPVFWDLSTGLLLSQTLRGEILGDTRDPGKEESRDLDASYAFLVKFAREMKLLFPSLANIHVLRQWAGHYDVSPDGSPILGEAEELENLVFASGFSGHGLMLSPIVGKLFAEMFETGKVPDLIHPYRFSRFAEGKPILEPLVAGRNVTSG
ncbi:MAG: FAD-binding oxidoreductase [Conexivisphaerales archaeon]